MKRSQAQRDALCGYCQHPWTRHHSDESPPARRGIACSRFSSGGEPCEKDCPGFEPDGAPVIYFRSDGSRDAEHELEIASKHFTVVRNRGAIPEGALVICRYSALPFRKELKDDLALIDARLLNSPKDHSWIADFDWYSTFAEAPPREDGKPWTPRSWTEREFPTCDHPGPFVIKGRTNSRKFEWKTRMFAEDRARAMEIAGSLAKDDLIGPQGLVYREYVPLVSWEHDFISGLPFAHEWRFFFLKTTCIAHGYYWSSASEEHKAAMKLPPEARAFAQAAANIAAEHTTGFVLDVAERADGGWILVEVNSLEMSGLSEIDPEDFYRSLHAILYATAPAP